MTPYESALIKAKVAFMEHKGTMFISTVCFQLNIHEDPTIPTLCTDGKSMRINPKFFVETLNAKTREAALAHETYHVIYQHMGRRGARDPKKYNYAGDYRINFDLKKAGFTIGDNWLYNEAFGELSTEEIYDLLPDPPPEDAAGGSGPPMPGQGTPGEGDDIGEDIQKPAGASEEATRADIDKILIRAAIQTKMAGQAGSIPGDIQVYLDSLLKPKLPLAALLRRFFTDLDKSDYSWSRPNRRYRPMYLPHLRGFNLGEIAFAYDMSGSVSDKDTQRYASEVAGVMRNLKPSKMTLVQFDTEIRSVDKIQNVADMGKIKLVGRGGTWIEPLMEWAKKNRPTALVVFTDGEYNHPTFDPGCPVLWMIHGHSRNSFHCDFGRTVLFEV